MQHHLHMAFSTHYTDIYGHIFLTWLPDDYAAISSQVCEIFIYKRMLIIFQKWVTAFSEIVLYNFPIVLCLTNSYRSHLHAGGILSGLASVYDVCFLVQTNEVNNEIIINQF